MKWLSLPTSLFATIVPCLPLIASDKKNDQAESSLNFVVLKDDSGKPIRNAAVILHLVGQHGKQGKAGFELKTDNDGKTHFDGIPYGNWQIQVFAPGFQTFGEDYAINQATQEITIRLKRPQGQYSIYGTQEGSSGGNSGSNPPPNAKQ
jgi:hypothetical protein